MSKTYEVYCQRHGRIIIEVEKPPLLPGLALFCPWCAQRLVKSDISEKKMVMEPNQA